MPTKVESDRKRRICIFCQTWESGGIESFIHALLHHMNISHIEIDLVAEKIGESIFQKPLEQLGVSFYELSGSTHRIWTNYQRFATLMRQRKYDVIHLNVFQAQSMMYLPLAKRNQIPIRIVHSHNTALRKSKTRLLKLWVHCGAKLFFSGYATDWWACSSTAAHFMFPQRIITRKAYCFVPNGINLKKFQFDSQMRQKIRAELQLDQHFVIGNVGRLCYQKNQAFLLDIFPAVYKEIPESKLLLVGAGDEFPLLRRLADSLGILDHVIFYGTSNHVEQLLWAMDVFAFPSQFEGLGIGLIEAQAAGLPAVCSDQVPLEAIVSPNTVSIPLCKRNAWVQTFIQLYKKPRTHTPGDSRLLEFDIRWVGRWIEEKYLR